MKVPLDLAPESRAIFARIEELGLFDVEFETVEQMRAMARAEVPLMGPKATVEQIEDIEIESPGGELRLRRYTPQNAMHDRTILWFHGGGWVLGDSITPTAMRGASVKTSDLPSYRSTTDSLPSTRFPLRSKMLMPHFYGSAPSFHPILTAAS